MRNLLLLQIKFPRRRRITARKHFLRQLLNLLRLRNPARHPELINARRALQRGAGLRLSPPHRRCVERPRLAFF